MISQKQQLNNSNAAYLQHNITSHQRIQKNSIDENLGTHQRIGAYSNSPKNHKIVIGQGKMFLQGGKTNEYITINNENNHTVDVPNLHNLKSQNQNYMMLSQEIKKTPSSTKNLANNAIQSKIIFPNAFGNSQQVNLSN